MIDQTQTPLQYANRLARYISDPSTIRSRTIEYWGRAPSLEKCRELRRRATLELAPSAEKRGVRPFKCGHERTEDNWLLAENGDVKCRQCQDVKDAKKAREEAERERKREAARRAAYERAMRQEETRRAVAEKIMAGLSIGYVSIYDLAKVAAGMAGLTVQEVAGKGRSSELVRARFAVYMVAHERGQTFAQIGRIFGGRDHSTIINGYRKAKDAYAKDAKVRAMVDALRAYAGLE